MHYNHNFPLTSAARWVSERNESDLNQNRNREKSVKKVQKSGKKRS